MRMAMGGKMNKLTANLMADKITNRLMTDGPLRDAWFQMAPEERSAFEERLAIVILEILTELEEQLG